MDGKLLCRPIFFFYFLSFNVVWATVLRRIKDIGPISKHTSKAKLRIVIKLISFVESHYSENLLRSMKKWETELGVQKRIHPKTAAWMESIFRMSLIEIISKDVSEKRGKSDEVNRKKSNVRVRNGCQLCPTIILLSGKHFHWVQQIRL